MYASNNPTSNSTGQQQPYFTHHQPRQNNNNTSVLSNLQRPPPNLINTSNPASGPLYGLPPPPLPFNPGYQSLYTPNNANIQYSDTQSAFNPLKQQNIPQQLHPLMRQQPQLDSGFKVEDLVVELLNPKARDQALLELSKKREQYDDLALMLWHSFGVMTILIQEIIAVFPMLSPPTLTSNSSNRVCNALALLQCVASHAETRGLFLNAHIPLFLYPFLNTTSKNRPFEYLRLTSLGVIGALVKNDSTDVITFLLSTEIIPLCLRIMETGSELSKIVAIFIVQKILIDPIGLSYICQTYERFYAVGTVLGNMVTQLVESQSVRLLKHVIRCYLRLSDNPRAREALRQCLPEPLRDSTFAAVLKDDTVSKRCLGQLLINLSDPQVMVQDSRANANLRMDMGL